MRKTALKFAGVACAVALCSTMAFGLPWDVDMADAQTVKAYEKAMVPISSDSVGQPNVLTPAPKVKNYPLGSSEIAGLKNPLEENAENTAMGKKMYETYCTPCHGNGVKLGPVSKKGYPAIATLAGSGGVLKDRTDGKIYTTIRNGHGIMPAYGWAMNDTEMWALVQFARTLPNSKRAAPKVVPSEETP